MLHQFLMKLQLIQIVLLFIENIATKIIKIVTKSSLKTVI